MKKILVLFAHPAFEKSRVHKILLKYITMDGITVNDLYERYPEFDIDVKREQQLLTEHDIVIWQHPFYWYSSPAILKQWQDLVLEHGWAYGKNGYALRGKKIFNTITSGGGMESYQAEGYQRCTIHELMRPFERTAQLCRMMYLPPFWIPGTHKLELDQMHEYGTQYKTLLIALRDDTIKEEEIAPLSFLNDLVTVSKTL